MARTPNESVNLPHRDYWLAPERRAATLGFLAEHLRWMGAATIALLAAMMHLTFRANLAPGPSGPALGSGAWWILGAYLLFTGGWLFDLTRRFGRPPAA